MDFGALTSMTFCYAPVVLARSTRTMLVSLDETSIHQLRFKMGPFKQSCKDFHQLLPTGATIKLFGQPPNAVDKFRQGQPLRMG